MQLHLLYNICKHFCSVCARVCVCVCVSALILCFVTKIGQCYIQGLVYSYPSCYIPWQSLY